MSTETTQQPSTEKTHKGKRKDTNFFIMLDTWQAKTALKYWLRRRDYNSYSMGSTDKQGRDIIGLSWELRPDSDYSKFERRGIIVCVNESAYATALKLVEEGKRK